MKHEVTFGIIAAMDSELTELAAHLQDTERTRAGGLELLTGRLGTHSVVLVRCGVGKVSAARCAQLLIDRFAPKYLINTGIAGGIAHVLGAAGAVDLGDHNGRPCCRGHEEADEQVDDLGGASAYRGQRRSADKTAYDEAVYRIV